MNIQNLLNTDLLEQKFFILGGGSNVLFLNDYYNGSIIHQTNSNISIIKENTDEVIIKSDAGTEWDRFVEFVCKHNYWGAENLSYIPGTVGASAIQNIGAYGVEAKDIIYSVDVLEFSTGKKLTLTNKECKFAYRNSIFKEKEFENKYIVYSVTFKLLKHKKINLGYGNLKEKIQSVNNIKASDIRSLIINTRKAKLPETSELGSAGSFFKNPVIDKIQFEQIKKQYKNIPHFKQNDKYKIPAAWLIDKAGWKAKQIGNVSTYKNQALVIINATGNATGKEIACFANKIVNEVYQKFNIKLSPEVIYVE